MTRIGLFLISLFLGLQLQAQSLNADYVAYIKRYAPIAQKEMDRAGIPASIKLAQGLLESNAGRSKLAKKGNNHFGIKCGNNWKGKVVYQKDDEYNAQGKRIESCFRKFKSVEACYIAHSEFLRDPSKHYRYGPLFSIDPTDYRRWAHGLKKAGYATSATYAEKLIKLIEQYKLYEYDKSTPTVTPEPDFDIIPDGILSVNDVMYTEAQGGETVEDIARRTDIAIRNILKYNERLNSSTQSLDRGQKIFIQPKRNAYRGKEAYHVMKPGQDISYVSDYYGIKLQKLLHRNRLEEGMTPAIGQRIKLRGRKVKERPQLASEPVAPIEDKLPMIEDEEGHLIIDRDTISGLPDISTPIESDTTTMLPPVDSTVINEVPQIDTTATVPIIENPQEENEDNFNEEDLFPEEESGISTDVVIPSPNIPDTTPSTVVKYHWVSTGDTLWNISKRYDTTVAQIKKWNNLKTNTINKGTKLRVQ